MVGYVTAEELEAYALARGVALTGDPDVLITLALDWLEVQPFSGSKADTEQALQFPRNGSETVPENIKKAQMVAALLIDSGEDLMGPIGRRVTSETVFGAVAVTYSDSSGPSSTLYPMLSALLREFVGNGGGASIFGVRRG